MFFSSPAPLFPSLSQLLSTVFRAHGQLSLLCTWSLCPFPGQEVLPCALHQDTACSDIVLPQTCPLVHAALWAFMFLPHNVLQARGTRCPEHLPVVTEICQEPGFFPHPPAWQPFPAAPERSFPHCCCPQSARLSLVIVPSPGNAAEQGQGAWQCFSVTKKRCVRGLDCK